jgi:hypothetical protein
MEFKIRRKKIEKWKRRVLVSCSFYLLMVARGKLDCVSVVKTKIFGE